MVYSNDHVQMSKYIQGGLKGLHQTILGIPEDADEDLKSPAPEIVQEHIDNGLIEIHDDGSVWTSSVERKKRRLGNLKNIALLAQRLGEEDLT